MNNVPMGTLYLFGIVTSNSAGEAVNADETPSYYVIDGSGVAVVTDVLEGVSGQAGVYRGDIDITQDDFAIGSQYFILARAIVDTIVGKTIVDKFQVVAEELEPGRVFADVASIAESEVAAQKHRRSLVKD